MGRPNDLSVVRARTMPEPVSFFSKAAKVILEKAPLFWARILPDRDLKAMTLRERTAFPRRVKRWRAVWFYATLCSLVLSVTSSPQGIGTRDLGIVFYALVGSAFVGCSVILYVSNSLERWLAPWRTSFGGAICIALPYLLPGILYSLPGQFWRKVLAGGDPWQDDGFRYNGVACASFVALNVMICVLFWWRSHDGAGRGR